MAENSAIEWTHHTFNPWWGCQKVSPACDHCYAERDAKRFAPGQVLWGVGAERRTFGDKHWQAPVKWNAQAKAMREQLGTLHERPRVFCASMADWLDLDGPLDEFVRLLDTIRVTLELDWLLLSKRIGNWRKRIDEAGEHAAVRGNTALSKWVTDWLRGYAPPNVWLGATVVNQEEADRDIPKLLQVPARVRFLSMEPLLGPVELGLCDCDHGSIPAPHSVGGVTCPKCNGTGGRMVDWVIVGGESGPQARPMRPDWARSLRDQCKAAGVPFMFKQWGEHTPGELADHPDYPGDGSAWRLDQRGERWHDPMEGLKPRDEWAPVKFIKVGKKLAGRQLDGVQHDGYPA